MLKHVIPLITKWSSLEAGLMLNMFIPVINKRSSLEAG